MPFTSQNLELFLSFCSKIGFYFVQDVVKTMIDLLKDPMNKDAEVRRMFRVFLITKSASDSTDEDDRIKLKDFSLLIHELRDISKSYDGIVEILEQVNI